MAAPAKPEGSTSLFSMLFAAQPVWAAALILALPVTATAMLLVPLALITKPTYIDMQLVTYRVSFTLTTLQGESGQSELIRSLHARSITLLSTDSVDLSTNELVDSQTASRIDVHTVQFRPHIGGWIEFKAEQNPLLLSEIRVSSESAVQISKRNDNLTVEIWPSDQGHGKISLNGPFSVVTLDCDIVDENGKRINGIQDRQQQRFLIGRSPTPVILNFSRFLDLRLKLDGGDRDFLGSFSEFMNVKHLGFPSGSGPDALPIKSGFVTFDNIKKPPLSAGSGFLRIPEKDIMKILTIGAKSGALELKITGTAGSLLLGNSEDEKLPSVLEWLYYNQRFGIILAVMVWISGAAIGSLRLMKDLTLSKGGRSSPRDRTKSKVRSNRAAGG